MRESGSPLHVGTIACVGVRIDPCAFRLAQEHAMAAKQKEKIKRLELLVFPMIVMLNENSVMVRHGKESRFSKKKKEEKMFSSLCNRMPAESMKKKGVKGLLPLTVLQYFFGLEARGLCCHLTDSSCS